MRFLSIVKEIYSVSFWVSPAGNETDFRRASKECCIYLRIEIRSWFQSHSESCGKCRRMSIDLQIIRVCDRDG
jgi:hypothetical protein